MPTDAEITFADHMGRFYARRYAFPPMVGRLLGYLAVCDPPEQSIGELAEALLASRSAIAGAVKVLETLHAGPPDACGRRADGSRPHRPELAAVDGHGRLRVPGAGRAGARGARGPAGRARERRAVLLEMSAFAEFLLEQMPMLQQGWQARREALVASGDLPALRPGEARRP